MPPFAKLIATALIAPALVFALISVAWSWFIVVAVIGYPIMVIATLIGLFALHKLFTLKQTKLWHQLPIVVVVTIATGLVVYVSLFYDAVFVRSAFSPGLARDYSLMGVVAGLCSWLLYNFGPLKVPAAVPAP